MKSLAVWYETKTENDKRLQLDVHFNYWKIRPKKKPFKSAEAPTRILDVGLMIQDSNMIDTLCIFLPAATDKVSVECLGERISKDTQLLSAIFNEHYQIQNADKARSLQIKNSGNEDIFHLITKPDPITKDPVEEKKGCLVRVPLEQVNAGKCYVRLRFTGGFLKDFSTEEQCANSILNSAFNRMEIFDFRLNSTRHLPLDVIERMDAAVRFRIKKAHFFLICSYKENFVLSHTPYLNARRLEEGVWEKYIDINVNESILAYQWTDKANGDEDLDAFGVLTKTSYRYNNWQTIGQYAIVAFLFSIAAGVTANTAFKPINSFIDSSLQQREDGDGEDGNYDSDETERSGEGKPEEEGSAITGKTGVRKSDPDGKQDS